jgi:NAD(P)H-nitrite reductase large subunit
MHHLIIGNGPAGVIAAETLRKHAPQDVITLMGDEPEPPYSRMAIPYLLHGSIEENGTWLRKSADHFANANIRLLEARARSIDTQGRWVRYSDHESIQYDRLLIATGSVPNRPPIPGIDLPNIHNCWTLEDARRIMAIAKPGAKVLQMGAGFIGCIIMEALAARGVDLTIVETGNRMVPRMMTEMAGSMIKQWCEKRGIKVHTGAAVTGIRQHNGRLVASLSHGADIEADLIISSTGVKPNIGFLAGSGIECEQGVLVDERMQTNIPNVYAAGDVSQSLDFSTGTRQVNAIQPVAADEARFAALNMAGKNVATQGNLAMNVLDTVGLIAASFGQWWGEKPENGGDHVEVVDANAFRYVRLEFRDDVLIGACSLGLTLHVGALRGLIQGRVPLGPWKAALKADPLRIMEAYIACAQKTAAW